MVDADLTAATRRHPPDVSVKRIYDANEPGDGYRVLIDHVWPRGVSRERAKLDEWARELAPGDELRRWFDHVPERFEVFARAIALSWRFSASGSRTCVGARDGNR